MSYGAPYDMRRCDVTTGIRVIRYSNKRYSLRKLSVMRYIFTGAWTLPMGQVVWNNVLCSHEHITHEFEYAHKMLDSERKIPGPEYFT